MINIRVIITDEDRVAVADQNVEKWYKRCLEGTPHGGSIHVATITMLERLRLAHVKEEIFIEAVIFEEEIILVDKNGSLSIWPDGMLDQWEKILSKLLGWRYD